MRYRPAVLLLAAGCLLGMHAQGQTTVTTQRVVQGLSSPSFAATPPGDTRLFVSELGGLLRVIENGVPLSIPFLDVPTASGNAFGQLYSFAFHPDYEQNGYVYVYYRGVNGGAWLERYTVSANPNVADPNSRLVILTTSLPNQSHSGQGPLFGPDGMLYVAFGDGTSGDDPTCQAQNTSTMFGNILRIDVDGGTPYVVPPDNPFVGQSGYLPEIWATGFRNPWRMGFDRSTGELYVADVGEDRSEEIDIVVPGANYGWSVEEGSLPYPHHCPVGTPPYGDPAYTRPIFEYDHSAGKCSITGGYVYRGAAMPELRGSYFFADWCSDEVWSLRHQNGLITELIDRTAEIQPNTGVTLQSIVSFAEDGEGELYVIDRDAGSIYKIVPECGAVRYCTANDNSTGTNAKISATGSSSVAGNALLLSTIDVPLQRFGYYLMSRTPDIVTIQGSSGLLCLGSPFYRFSSDILNSGPSGTLTYPLDLTDLPQNVSIQVGETWHFQAWFRDSNPVPTSNTSDGLSVTFCP